MVYLCRIKSERIFVSLGMRKGSIALSTFSYTKFFLYEIQVYKNSGIQNSSIQNRWYTSVA